jgi:hypothetical protein
MQTVTMQAMLRAAAFLAAVSFLAFIALLLTARWMAAFGVGLLNIALFAIYGRCKAWADTLPPDIARRWSETFSAYRAPRWSAAARGSVVKGLGSISGALVKMETIVDSSGVGLFCGQFDALPRVLVPWARIQSVSRRSLALGPAGGCVAELALAGTQHPRIMIPWSNEFDRFVPENVGLQ